MSNKPNWQRLLTGVAILALLTSVPLIGHVFLAGVTNMAVLLHFLVFWVLWLMAWSGLRGGALVLSSGLIIVAFGLVPSPNYWSALIEGNLSRAQQDLGVIVQHPTSIVGVAALMLVPSVAAAWVLRTFIRN